MVIPVFDNSSCNRESYCDEYGIELVNECHVNEKSFFDLNLYFPGQWISVGSTEPL